jgi:hypothetical protein
MSINRAREGWIGTTRGVRGTNSVSARNLIKRESEEEYHALYPYGTANPSLRVSQGGAS